MLVEVPEPWTPAQATERIRHLANGGFDISYKWHAKDQLADRGLIMGDVTHVLKFGFVYEPAQPSSRPALWKYQMESRTPNSGNRNVRLVLIPSWKSNHIKIITVMWADEPLAQGR